MAVNDQELETAKEKFVASSNQLTELVQGDATTDVDIGGGKSLPSIAKLQAEILGDYQGVEQQSNRDKADGYPSLNGTKLTLLNAAALVKSYLQSVADTARTWTMPDKDGIVAMTSDIAASAALQEKVANKAVDFTVVNDTKFPTVQAVKTYIDNATTGVLNDRGNWDASVNTFPTAGGSGAAGAIRKGDIYFISVAGVIGGQTVSVGDSVRALANTPGQTAANWNILDANINYVAENNANKDATGGYAGLTLFKLNVMNAAGTVKSFFTTTATAARTYTLPDKDGTVAMLSDILATTLTGLAAGTNTALAAGNSILVALQNLQAQIKAIPYDFTIYTGPSKPAASQVILYHHAARAFTIPANFAGAKVSALTSATAATVWTLYKNGTAAGNAVGTMTWGAAGTVPTLATTGGAAISVAVDDKLYLQAASTQDNTLAGVSGAILATLT